MTGWFRRTTAVWLPQREGRLKKCKSIIFDGVEEPQIAQNPSSLGIYGIPSL